MVFKFRWPMAALLGCRNKALNTHITVVCLYRNIATILNDFLKTFKAFDNL